MKLSISYFFSIVIITALVLSGCDKIRKWGKSVQGNVWSEGRVVSYTPKNHIFLAGNIRRHLNGNLNGALWKMNNKGDSLWFRSYGDKKTNKITDMEFTSENNFLMIGETPNEKQGSNNIYAIKVDYNGQVIWKKNYGGPGNEFAKKVKELKERRYLITGYTNSFGNKGYNGFLLKMNQEGDTLWMKTYGKDGNERFFDLDITSTGEYILSGSFTDSEVESMNNYIVKTDDKGNVLWQKKFGDQKKDMITGAVLSNDNGVAITGYTENFGDKSGDIYHARVDYLGNIEWQNTFGGDNEDKPTHIISAEEQKFLILGETKSWGAKDGDIILIKTNKKGKLLWKKQYGGQRKEIAWNIVPVNDKGYLISGYSESFQSEIGNAFIIRIDKSGNKLWRKVIDLKQKSTFNLF